MKRIAGSVLLNMWIGSVAMACLPPLPPEVPELAEVVNETDESMIAKQALVAAFVDAVLEFSDCLYEHEEHYNSVTLNNLEDDSLLTQSRLVNAWDEFAGAFVAFRDEGIRPSAVASTTTPAAPAPVRRTGPCEIPALLTGGTTPDPDSVVLSWCSANHGTHHYMQALMAEVFQCAIIADPDNVEVPLAEKRRRLRDQCARAAALMPNCACPAEYTQ